MTVPAVLSEVFGPTIQGEGLNAGQIAAFIRFAGCNLSCSWCDAAYTWDWSRFTHSEEAHKVPVEEAAERLAAIPGRIVVTGGEPLLQHRAIAALMDHPALAGRPMDLETNGTRPLGETEGRWDHITCSPKVIPSAGAQTVAMGRVLDPGVVASPATHFKFVVAGEEDLRAVEATVADYDLPGERVWLMPEGTTTETVTARTRQTAEWALERGWNFTSRLHIYAWGDARGY